MEEILRALKSLTGLSSDISIIAANVLQQKIIPLVSIVFLVYVSVWVGKILLSDKENLQSFVQRCVNIGFKIILLSWGVYFLGFADQFCDLIENAVNSTSNNLNSAVSEHYLSKADAATKNGIAKTINNHSTAEMIFIEKRAGEYVDNSHKMLTEGGVEAVIERQNEAGYSDITNSSSYRDEGEKSRQIAASMAVLDAKQHMVQAGKISFWSMDIEEIFSSLVSMLAIVVQCLIRAIRLVFLVIFKISFPIVVMISMIPTKGKIINTFMEGYASFLLWTVVVSLIEVANKIIFAALLVEGGGETNTWFVIIFGVIVMVTYAVVPNVTVMLFGGNTVSATVMSAVANSVGKYTGMNSVVQSVGKMADGMIKKQGPEVLKTLTKGGK